MVLVASLCTLWSSWSIQEPRPAKQAFLIAVESAIRCTKELHSDLASNHNFLPRATEKALAIFIRLSFQNRHDEDKSLERTERNNKREGVARCRRCRRLETGEGPDGSSLRSWPDLPNGFFDHRAPRQRAGSLHRHADSINTSSYPTNKTLFSLVAVGR